MTTKFDVKTFDVKKFDRILSCGLSQGLGKRGSQVCIEAAICQVLDMPHSDDPKCVTPAVRSFKIALNDKRWSSPKARAEGLRDLGLAQLGSLGVVTDAEFIKRLAEKIIRVLIPTLFREVFPNNQKCLDAALRCGQEGTKAAAAAYDAADAASYAAYAASYASYAADAASYASAAAYASDKYLRLSANLALEVLRELNSPGVCLV